MSTAVNVLDGPRERFQMRLRQAWAVACLDLARIRHGRHFKARVALLSLPVLLAILHTAVRMYLADEVFVSVLSAEGVRSTALMTLSDTTKDLWPVYFRFVLFVATLELFGGLVRQEFSEGTLHHLFLMPLRRETTLLGKYIAGVVLLTSLCSLSWLLTSAVMLIPYGPSAGMSALLGAEGLRVLSMQVLMTFLVTASYGSLFLLAGLLMRSPVLVGIVVWGLEGMSTILPQSFKELTLLHYVNSFAPLRFASDNPLSSPAVPSSPFMALMVLTLFSAVCLTASALLMRRLQLSYGGSE